MKNLFEKDLNEFIYFTDGACMGNPGEIGCGVWMPGEGSGFFKKLGTGTNNQAEFGGLIAALNHAIENKKTNVHIFMDSMLVVKTVNGEWNAKHPNIISLHGEAVILSKKIPQFKLSWVPREENVEADEMAAKSLGGSDV